MSINIVDDTVVAMNESLDFSLCAKCGELLLDFAAITDVYDRVFCSQRCKANKLWSELIARIQTNQ